MPACLVRGSQMSARPVRIPILGETITLVARAGGQMAIDPDPHEWFSWTDPDENTTYLFDVTFLASNWECIFGAGCLGVHEEPTPERMEGCCSFGAHFGDKKDRRRVTPFIDRLSDSQWQFKGHAADMGGPIVKGEDGWTTRTVDGACIMLNRPGFPGGEGCALHIAAVSEGERPLDWKPEVCWQLPLRLEHSEDTLGHDTYTLREWKRRDWGDGGVEFHWWCTDDPLAFRGTVPVWQYAREEIIELVGAVAYGELSSYLLERGSENLIPHPVVRRGARVDSAATRAEGMT